MLKWVLYPMFGLGVLTAYGASAAAGVDLTSSNVRTRAMEPIYAGGGYRTAPPMIWRTGFHGPAAWGGEDSGGSSGGGGFFGGYSGGK